MDDLISRQDAIEEFYGVKFDEGYCTEYEIGYNDGIDFAVDRLSVLPSAQQERKKGEWIKATGMMPPEFHGRHCCSECGNFANMEPPFGNREDLSKFCPNCGAYMRERKEE